MQQAAEVKSVLADEHNRDCAPERGELRTPVVLPFVAEYISARLIQGQAQWCGVSPQDIFSAEVARGSKIDQRVTADYLLKVMSRSQAAQKEFHDDLQQRLNGDSERLRIFLAPTARAIDHLIDCTALQILVGRLVEDGKAQELKDAINSGPGNSEVIWNAPETLVHLVASIVRWGALTDHDKKRIRVSGELREEILDILTSEGYDTRPRIGCISAVGTALASVLGHEPTMMALGTMPYEVARRLPAQTRIVGTNAEHQFIEELPGDDGFCGNFALLVPDGCLGLEPILGTLQVNGAHLKEDAMSKIDVLITGTSSIHGFSGVGLERMCEIGSAHDLMILTGTKDLDSKEEMAEFFDRVSQGHAAGMAVALCYAESKFPAKEVELWCAIRQRRCVELLALNSLEALGVLERIYQDTSEANSLKLSADTILRLNDALVTGKTRSSTWGDGHESPEWLIKSAMLIQEILQIPIVRVRGMVSDILVTDAALALNAEDTRGNLFVSRNLGTMKVAHPRGLFANAQEIGNIRNYPDGTHAAALFKIADVLKWLDGNSAEVESFAHNQYMLLKDGRYAFAVPPTPFYSKEGGTMSAGDTKDLTLAFVEGAGLMRAARDLNITGHTPSLNLFRNVARDESAAA